jgi:hypothetical protein
VHANQPLTPSLRRIGRQQSVRWGREAAHQNHRRAGRGLRITGVPPTCPRTAINGQQSPSAATCEPKVREGAEPRSNARDTLVMRRSLGSDKDQGAEAPTVVRDRRRRARCVPDRPVNAGNLRSLPDNPIRPLTCVQAGRPAARTELLSNGSRRPGFCWSPVSPEKKARGQSQCPLEVVESSRQHDAYPFLSFMLTTRPFQESRLKPKAGGQVSSGAGLGQIRNNASAYCHRSSRNVQLPPLKWPTT